MRIIIVGGGFCGSTLALRLNKYPSIDTILIDERPYYEYTPALPKLLSKKLTAKNIHVKYKDFLTNVTHITDTVSSVTPTKVSTTNKQFIYDYLVICPGIKYPIPFKNTSRLYTIKNAKSTEMLSKNIQKHQKILIVGGGIVGVEVAAEIATTYPEKDITMIHPQERLINRNPPFASHYTYRLLTKLGVTIHFNNKVESITKNTYTLANGKTIDADVGIWCAGNKSDSSFMKEFPSSVYSERNALNVNRYLQLKGFENIFVGGDLTSIKEEKTAFNADRHAKYIHHNLIGSIKNKPLKHYSSIPAFLIISLGKKNGILTYRNIIIPGMTAALLKWIVRRIILISRH